MKVGFDGMGQLDLTVSPGTMITMITMTYVGTWTLSASAIALIVTSGQVSGSTVVL